MIQWQQHRFHPVVRLPADYEVYDFTRGYDENRPRRWPFGIGRYDEKRSGMYTTELFSGVRDVHMGIDIAAPVGTEIHAFYAGRIHLFGYNGAPGDYGWTLVTRHVLDGVELYALHGHLAGRSVAGRASGDEIKAGEVIAWVGDRHENGGWNPHLHFQLSLERPDRPDLPGVVAEAEREAALRKYPDPRLVLGPLY